MCAFAVQLFAPGCDGVIKLIDLCAQRGRLALPGGLVSMATCGNQGQ